MSYDLFVQDLPRDLDTVDDIPDDYEPKSLGARGALVARIRGAAPTVDFSDPCWGVVKTDDFTVEIDLREADPVPSFSLHLSGSDGALLLAHQLLSALGLAALDPQAESGLFVFDDEALENYRAWRKFQDSVADEA